MSSLTELNVVQCGPEMEAAQENTALPKRIAVKENGLQCLRSEGFVDLNFKVEPELRQRFKMEAVRRGMSNKEFLAACFQIYMETYPSDAGIVELREPTKEQRSRRIELRKQRAARMAKIRRKA